jgi:hypothetical protein
LEELRSSVRFPIRLPIEVHAEDLQHDAETRDISAGGVLFHVDADLAVGSSISFSIGMPSSVLGTEHDVFVHCLGRVVRSFSEGGRRAVAAVIDEYQFERHQVA